MTIAVYPQSPLADLRSPPCFPCEQYQQSIINNQQSLIIRASGSKSVSICVNLWTNIASSGSYRLLFFGIWNTVPQTRLFCNQYWVYRGYNRSMITHIVSWKVTASTTLIFLRNEFQRTLRLASAANSGVNSCKSGLYSSWRLSKVAHIASYKVWSFIWWRVSNWWQS